MVNSYFSSCTVFFNFNRERSKAMTFSTTGCLLFSDKDNALSRAELAPAGITTTAWIYQQQDRHFSHWRILKMTICTLSGLLTRNSHRCAAPGNYSPGSSHCLHFHFDCWRYIVLPHLPKKVGKKWTKYVRLSNYTTVSSHSPSYWTLSAKLCSSLSC